MKGRLREIRGIGAGAGVLLLRCRRQMSSHCPGQKRRRKDELGLNHSATLTNLRTSPQQVYSLPLICLSLISLAELRLSDPLLHSLGRIYQQYVQQEKKKRCAQPFSCKGSAFLNLDVSVRCHQNSRQV